MARQILITGGAGFIGSHVTDELLAHGYRVRVLDNLCSQVHGPDAVRPDYFSPDAELMLGDVRDAAAVKRALRGVDAVLHLAAAVGVGQSMYEITHYTSVNNSGTAVLLEALIDHPVKRLVVASSMSLYGEGAYCGLDGRPAAAVERPVGQLKRKDWEVRDARGNVLTPIPTPESKPPSLASVYALSKYDQERMCLIVGRAYGIETAALRFFNVYGPRQALSNPYTGVLAIFASRLLNGHSPLVYEDGEQKRDFVHVTDIARACRLAIASDHAAGRVFNIGSGQAYTVREVAHRLARAMDRPELTPEITEKYRMGDIRHCFADIRAARHLLGYEPKVNFDQGLSDLVAWLEHQSPQDRIAEASAELSARGLAI